MLGQEAKDRIIELKQTGLSIAKIAVETGYSKNTVHRILRQSNCDLRRNRLSQDDEQCVVEAYLSGKTPTILASEYKVDPVTILNIVRRRNAKLRPRGAQFREMTQDEEQSARTMWLNGLARWEIANQLSVGTSTLDRWLMSMGLNPLG